MGILVAGTALAFAPDALFAAPVTGWMIGQNNGGANLSLTAADTASPLWGNNGPDNADATSIYAPLPEVALSGAGDRVTLTGSATLSGITASGDQFRWGLFHTTGSANFNGWLGYSAANGNGTSGGPLRERNAGNATFYYVSTETTLLATSASPGGVAISDGAYTISLVLERVAGGLQIHSSLVRVSDARVFTSHDYLDATPSMTTFNRVALLAGGAMNTDQILLSNIEVRLESTDSDHDGLPDAWETDNELIIGIDDSEGNPDGDGLTNIQEYQRGTDPQERDTDHDGLDDEVETGTGLFVSAQNTGTNPLLADSDGDGISDGAEVANETDPNDLASPGEGIAARLFGIDFNRSDAPGAPSQGLCRIIAGSTTQAANPASITKVIGNRSVTISQPDAVPLEFRGANGDGSRAIPGGDISRSFMVADFVGTRAGQLDLTLSGLAAGDYVCRSYHLDSFTGTALGFAQGVNSMTRNTLESRVDGTLRATMQPNALGSPGLNTTFINDSLIPTLRTRFTSDGVSPVVISFTATDANGADRFVFLNGFELFEATP